MRRLVTWFLEGLLFLVPLAITLWVFWVMLVKIDRLLGIPIPGVGLVLTIALVTLVGFLASNFLTRRVLALVDVLFQRMPLVRLLYSSVKDLVGAFVGERRSFTRPVLVRLPGDEGVAVLGFVTGEAPAAPECAGMVAVYLPQSYNFAGNLVLVARDRVTPLEMSSGEVMTFIVSGGVAGRHPGGDGGEAGGRDG
ncbi:MAG: DUF502 domain-containing protein [Syntrophomonadaceae bacterium]|nr:DUF502 domain-containing protein [Syntrophomonadaceae bacterium]MDH7498083.1 DUF502 domain-containing protein [Syntrophomonadaceae bacterium]